MIGITSFILTAITFMTAFILGYMTKSEIIKQIEIKRKGKGCKRMKHRCKFYPISGLMGAWKHDYCIWGCECGKTKNIILHREGVVKKQGEEK